MYAAGGLGFFLLKETQVLVKDPGPLLPSELFEIHRIGHAAHVQGALIGMAWAILRSSSE